MKKYNHALLCAALIFTTITPRTNNTIIDDVRAGNADAIKNRINNDEDCSETEDGTGNNALHVAAEENQSEIIDILTREPDYSTWGNWLYYSWYNPAKLPNKNAKNNSGNAPLQLALDKEHVEATNCLVNKGVDLININATGLPAAFVIVEKIDRQDKPLTSLLVKKQLLKQRLNGYTPLDYAMKKGNAIATQEIIKKTSLAAEQNDHGETAAIVASKLSTPTMLQILHDMSVNLNAPGYDGKRPLHHAGQQGNYGTTKFLLEHNASIEVTDNKGNSPLQSCAAAGQEKTTDLLLAHHADVKHCNNEGKDAFAIATDNKHRAIVKRLKEHPEVNINARNSKDGTTAFMREAKKGDYVMMECLIALGVNTRIADNDGKSSLHHIAEKGDTRAAHIVLLHDKNALNDIDQDGNSALFVAIRNGHTDLVSMLFKSGTSLHGKNKYGETIWHQTTYAKKTAPLIELLNTRATMPYIDTPDNRGWTALHTASANNNIEVFKLLQQSGAAFNYKTPEGNNIAHTATTSGALDIVQELKTYYPLMFREYNKAQETPFLIATRMGYRKATKILLQEADFTNNDIDRGIVLAQRNNHYQIVHDLQNAKLERKELCKGIESEYYAVQNIIEQKKHYINYLAQKKIEHIATPWLYQPLSLTHYSPETLYYMTTEEQNKIRNHYAACKEAELKDYRTWQKEYNSLIQQEERQKIEDALRQKEEAENRRIAQLQQQQKEERERLRKQQEEDAKIVAQQTAELERIRKEKEAKDQAQAALKAQADGLKCINDQKAELEHYAQQKALADKVKADNAKHDAALDKQQDYVPMDLKASAPPADDSATQQQCLACGGKGPSKPLPCVKCKQKVTEICPNCVKTYKGRCPGCWHNYNDGVEKQKGECYLGWDHCSDKEKGVFRVPCSNCETESSSDLACAPCLQEVTQMNADKGMPDKCPRCSHNTLDKTRLQRILAQK